MQLIKIFKRVTCKYKENDINETYENSGIILTISIHRNDRFKN